MLAKIKSIGARRGYWVKWSWLWVYPNFRSHPVAHIRIFRLWLMIEPNYVPLDYYVCCGLGRCNGILVQAGIARAGSIVLI